MMPMLKKWINDNVPAEFDISSFAFCQLVSASFLWLFAKRLMILTAEKTPSTDTFQYVLLAIGSILCWISFHAGNFNFKVPWVNHQFLYLAIKVVGKLFVILYVAILVLTATQSLDGQDLSQLALTVIFLCLVLGWLSGFQVEKKKGDASDDK